MKVSLVGAGPGDPGLITLRGLKLLKEADVVIFDALVNRHLLKAAKKSAQLIYVGKVAGSHTLSQDQINELMAEKALAGYSVVRLKGGDPYIFGRGGEEGEYLASRGIPFEEVPGISSAIAAPAYAGIPLTHRNLVSAVTIITGHERPDKKESSHNWHAYAASGATLVVVMGVKQLPNITSALQEGGLPPDTPAALIYQGTTPRQRTLYSTLANLASAAAEAGFSNPSVAVIGKVVDLHSILDWFGAKPLLGRTIAITRAREQASGMAQALMELGADVLECPGIEIVPFADNKGAEPILGKLVEYDWIIFTSVNGVKFFWRILRMARLDTRSLSHAKIAAIGPATAESLSAHGIDADLMPESYVAESVAQALKNYCGDSLRHMKILIPRAAKARNVLQDELAKAGAAVDILPLYETRTAASCRTDLLTAMANNSLDCITFGSSSTVDNFFSMISPEELRRYPQIALAVIGPVTAATLEKYGYAPAIIPGQYTIPALVEAITQYFAHR